MPTAFRMNCLDDALGCNHHQLRHYIRRSEDLDARDNIKEGYWKSHSKRRLFKEL